mmetsp:Transcript_619/g.827  ORF Transcript_619/g.827 Transcript_619/m.827 type:complete len:660 (+) Transcript_619:229-2208(+)|eukprot:CAMPEP_0172514954 /NCGR_PEP_ID=MMETSP1066-20121228/264168_1 /TAXON_ID=671091 /ORGANISM="Coscinodiscus wailesii, Strain CCMP2513" /LENGTH=659 /DNA_ID=CAMNT_0013295837 /DNA_START=152 /DNA_END=2131 /DNA_ORIENTATION=+
MGNEISLNSPKSDKLKEFNDDGCMLGSPLPLCRGVDHFTTCAGEDEDVEFSKLEVVSDEDLVSSDPDSSVSVKNWKNPNMGEPGISTELHKLISLPGSDNKWDSVMKRMKSNPEEASMRDDKCRTALALACSNSGCPAHVIRELLSLSPRSPSMCDKNGSYPLHFYAASESPFKEVSLLQLLVRYHEEAALTRNKFGNTPLQAAIEANSLQPDILKALILANTKAVAMTNSHGSYPLHYAWKDQTPDLHIVKLLLKLYPKAISLQNDYGATPIFMAVNWDATYDVMELLLKACPSAVRIKDERGICSISSAWNLFIHQVKVDSEADVSKEKERVKRNRRLIKFAASPYDLEGKAEIWWNKMQLLLKASYHNSISDPLPKSKWRVLHAAAGCDCPPELLTLVLKLYRNLLFIKDENDNLPIHIICATPSYVKQPFESAGDHMITKLVNEFPECAKVKGGSGRLPLHIAVDNKKTWSEGVSRLVELYPESVRAYDRKTRLYPAMLMAAADNTATEQSKRNVAERTAKTRFKTTLWKKLPSRRKEEEVEKILADLEILEMHTVYQLLRCAPELIARLGDEMRNKEKAYLKQDNEKQYEKFREMNYDAIALKRILVMKEKEYKAKLNELEREFAFLRETEEQMNMGVPPIQTIYEKRDDIQCS